MLCGSMRFIEIQYVLSKCVSHPDALPSQVAQRLQRGACLVAGAKDAPGGHWRPGQQNKSMKLILIYVYPSTY